MDASKVIISCSLVTISTVAAIWYYRKNKREQIPKEWTPVGRVSDLYLYPLKSGYRKELKEAECTYFGFRQITDEAVVKLRDRFLIVYNESDHEYRTGRTDPKLTLIQISNHDATHVALDAPGMRTLYVPIPKLSDIKPISCKLIGAEKTELIDCGKEAAEWLTRFLNKDSPLRLGYHDEEMIHRKANPAYLHFHPDLRDTDMGIFSDLTGYMLMTKKSVEDLNSRIEDKVTACQFRPNILVDGVQSAYVEDDWDWVKIGNDTVFKYTNACTRCIFTNVNPSTGTVHPKHQPLKTLKEYRQLPNEEERKVCFNSPVMGIHMGLRRAGVIKVDDIVYIAKT